MGSVIGGVLGYSSSKKQAKAAENAANTQAESTRYASDMQKDMFDEVRVDQKPYMQAGTTALDQLMGQMGDDGKFMQSYQGTDFNFKADPGYQFRKSEGMSGIQQSAAARGGLLSGATLKALNSYNSGLASQEYQNAFNRWQSIDNNNYERFSTDQTNQYNRLSNLVGVGQNAAAGVGNAGMQTSQAMANNTMAGANAQAAGTIGAANARAQGTQALGGALGGLIGGIGGMFI